MAEAPLKRQREEETHVVEELGEDTKRHKSYNHILSLIEAEEEVPTQDLSFLMSTLEHELSCDSGFDPFALTSSETIDPENPSTDTSDFTVSEYSSSPPVTLKEDLDEEEDKERVIKRLLEASDDELGIPQVEVRYKEEDEINGGDGFFSLCTDGLWEFEDEAANYYSYLQSELFM